MEDNQTQPIKPQTKTPLTGYLTFTHIFKKSTFKLPKYLPLKTHPPIALVLYCNKTET